MTPNNVDARACCHTEKGTLSLIETRFAAGQCFLELQCRCCNGYWTAEIASVIGEEAHDLLPKPLSSQPRWRVLQIWPRVAA